MTDPIDASYQLEAKKDGLSQTKAGITTIRLTVHPNDIPAEFIKDPMGQRYMIVMVPIGDNEEPIAKPKSFAQQAKLMAKEATFWGFLNYPTLPEDPAWNIFAAEERIEDYCGVKSCSELIEGTEAGKKFKRLQAEYLNWKN